MTLKYQDGPTVELFDRVDVHQHGDEFEGVIRKVHPRLEAVTVRIKDHVNVRRDGEPTYKTLLVPVVYVELVARDG